MSRKTIDLTGQKFGNLTVLRKAGTADGQVLWSCRCKCGRRCTAQGRYLKSGAIRSCGCLPKGVRGGDPTERNLRKKSQSLCNLELRDDDPYQNLANAIVAVAADDYRAALQDNNEKQKKDLEEFFYSEWYSQLTSIKPETLLWLLCREYNDELHIAYA